jgi:threonylcarbamoyladenosine tRNA methylthiotransferase MtaB
MSDLPSFCDHLHIPLQSGSGDVLRAMRRPYSPEQFAGLVDKARSLFPDMGLSTDMIVGFPGETDAQFQATMDFVEEIGFSRLHVFKFSPRKGTLAEFFEGRVPADDVARRSDDLIRLGQRLALDFHRRHVGRVLEVLVEESGAAPVLCGFTRNYIRTRFPGGEHLQNTLVDVLLEHADAQGAEGRTWT